MKRIAGISGLPAWPPSKGVNLRDCQEIAD
jgi:hypothetical protein